MSQLAYTVYMSPAFIGAHGQLIQVIPGRNNSGVEIPYGRAVQHDTGAGTSDLAVKLPAAGATELLIKGVVLYDQSHEPQTTGVPDDGIMSIVRQGTVFMQCEQAVTPDDPVYVRFDAAGATGTSPAVGQVRIDADTAKAVLMPRWRFESSAAAGAGVWVVINP
jgi:hypothetical protein